MSLKKLLYIVLTFSCLNLNLSLAETEYKSSPPPVSATEETMDKVDQYVDEFETLSDDIDEWLNSDELTYSELLIRLPERPIDYEKINHNMKMFGDKLSQKSSVFKHLGLTFNSPLTGLAHQLLAKSYLLPKLIKWMPAQLKIGFSAGLDNTEKTRVLKSTQLSIELYNGPKLRGGFGDDFTVRLNIEADGLKLLQAAVATDEAYKACSSKELNETALDKELPLSVKKIIATSCQVSKIIINSTDFTEMTSEIKPLLKKLKKLADQTIDEISEENVGSTVGFLSKGFYDYNFYANDCSYRPFICTPVITIKADAGAAVADIDVKFELTAENLSLYIQSDIHAWATANYIVDKEQRKEILVGVYKGLKIIEALTEENIDEAVDSLDSELKSLEEFVESVDENIATELNL